MTDAIGHTLGDDIPADLAVAAHRGTSFVPEQRGAQERAEYVGTLASDFAQLAQLATSDAKRTTLDAEFARYRQGFRQRYIALLAAKSRCISTMITGPSRFPTDRARKASDHADTRLADLLDYRKRALAAIRKELTPELQPIALGDSDASERIRQKLAEREARQAGMKAANAAIRANAKAGPEAQIAALVALGHTESAARDLLTPDFAGRIGFADYELKNNNAEIRRLKDRLALVERNQATAPSEAEGKHARMADVPAEHRVRLFFPGKPDASIRSRLKSNGFRWAPTLGCWQAFRNDRTLALAREIAGA